ncbi:hypothetical protein ASPFODRAFT_690965 [Aspergillus luchuensis CBS 106.47]|uniref:Uncharacterized protein n=1 Tax=Aspergillus luchuensis (strain CBS 106.47) TaxID=1137211 RepID=A0A1M3TD88_ASPLC|nr:hypothetical protein ASPFODRAFT_690965 [Aspergillus luchuensis CBS 106.47]
MRDLVHLKYQVSESLHRPCDAVDRHSTRVFSRRVAFAHEGRQLPRIAIASLYPLLTLDHLGYLKVFDLSQWSFENKDLTRLHLSWPSWSQS